MSNARLILKEELTFDKTWNNKKTEARQFQRFD